MAKARGIVVGGGLGAVAWLVPALFGPGPAAPQAGILYLVSLTVAGFLAALFDGELRWATVASLYGGQLVALGIWLALGHATGDEPLLLQPLFVLSFTLAAAIGGVVGAVLRGGWSKPA